jgi:hypothetical protein
VKLALIFFGTFFGTLALAAVVVRLLKALSALLDWVQIKTGRSVHQVSQMALVVLVALVIAGEITAIVAAGAKP